MIKWLWKWRLKVKNILGYFFSENMEFQIHNILHEKHLFAKEYSLSSFSA